MTVSSQARFEALMERLREREHRITPQRVALIRLLAANDDHPSVSQLYDQLRSQFPTTSLATVYKTLHLLQEMGEVLELGFGQEPAHYDVNRPYPHTHLICVRCGRITDTDSELAKDWIEDTARESGYALVSHRLDIYGLCPDCQERN